jgi:hypothetical protein
MRTYLEHLTTEDLIARLAKLKEMGLATAAKLASGERSEISTYVMARGRQVGVSRLQESLNWQRTAWKQTRQELRARGI